VGIFTTSDFVGVFVLSILISSIYFVVLDDLIFYIQSSWPTEFVCGCWGSMDPRLGTTSLWI